MRVRYSTALVLLFLPILSFAQMIGKADTLSAAIKTDLRGGQKTLSERLVVAKDISVMATPTGELDFIKFVQTLPGVAGGSDGASSYYVRGGNMGGNVQTLDGVPIYGTSHLIGLTSAYPADVISTAEFQVGGFSSDEGNLSSSHIRLRSKDGSFQTSSAKAEISNFLLGGTVSAPLVREKLSLHTAVRFSPAPYEYNVVKTKLGSGIAGIQGTDALIYDIYAKLKYRVDALRALSFSVFHSQDRYNFIMGDGSEDKMAWDNLLAIAQYDAPWRKRGELNVTASFNHYGNSQGMLKRLGGTSNDLLICSLLDEGMLHACVKTSFGRNWHAQYGLKARIARFDPGSSRVLETTGLFPKTSSPLESNPRYNFTGTLHGQMEHGSAKRHLLRLAGRLNYNDASGFAPEASILARFRFLHDLGVEVTGDYLTQFYHTLEGIPLGWSLDMIVPSSRRFMPEQTRQVYAGLFSDTGDHHFSAGAYYKKMTDLVFFSDATKLFDSAIAGWEEKIETGTGSSRGLEVLYEKTAGRATWRISYTWSKTDRLFPGLNQGEAFPAKYDRTHLLNATAAVRMVSRERMNLSLATLFTYQSGHMETVTAGSWWDDNFIIGTVEQKFYTSFNNYRMPPYIRLDVSALFEFKGGKHPQTLNAGVYNVLNRHNPFGLSYNPDTDEWKQISLLPVMPSLKYSVRF